MQNGFKHDACVPAAAHAAVLCTHRAMIVVAASDGSCTSRCTLPGCVLNIWPVLTCIGMWPGKAVCMANLCVSSRHLGRLAFADVANSINSSTFATASGCTCMPCILRVSPSSYMQQTSQYCGSGNHWHCWFCERLLTLPCSSCCSWCGCKGGSWNSVRRSVIIKSACLKHSGIMRWSHGPPNSVGTASAA